MTTASPILICPRVDLRAIPDADRDVLRRLVTQYVTGADRDHDREWRRLWRDLERAEPGECTQLYRSESRDGPFHRRHRCILANLLANVEGFANEDALHDFLKVKCWHVDWKNGKPTPASTSFDECSEARMRKFNRRLVDLLHTPAIQRTFWPAINSAQRAEMVELVLRNPNDQQETP
ncbi:hypothetical protein [Ramlibacter sp.]|uniref:hypothetical protein n=1 Tax=Ramlibacter sp. TaxID=1917967 RepID=UPI003D0B8408